MKKSTIYGLIANAVAITIYFSLLIFRDLDWINDDGFAFALVNIFFAGSYSIICILDLYRSKQLDSFRLPLLYSLWIISCFSLNLEINIFENLSWWAYVILAIFVVSSSYIYHNGQRTMLKNLAYFMNGFSFCMILYFFGYLVPGLPIFLLGIIVFGLGIHGLAPFIIICLHIYVLNFKMKSQTRTNLLLFVSGIFSVCLTIGIMGYLLNREANQMTQNSPMHSFQTHEDLPTWVQISQHIHPNIFNEILLKSDLVYNTRSLEGSNRFGGWGNKQYNERKVHNPLILVSLLFVNDWNLGHDDKVKILEANFDKRNESEEQLWSGDQLETTSIKEDVKIFEKEGLAYTELTMEVKNNQKWGDGEAIYSFQLPDGAVASSLSLWVNGVERKGVLTSKSKAKRAYDNIVGIQNRDPSLLQWREGNRIVCRIFPVSNKSPRQFKIGITSPLALKNNKLHYNNISIKGPHLSDAHVLSRVQVANSPHLQFSQNFKSQQGAYFYESDGYSKWSMTTDNTIAFHTHFQWEGHSYQIIPPVYTAVAFQAKAIYLDINSSWEKSEVKAILDHANDKKIYVFLNDQKQEINTSNYVQLFEEASHMNYSLFPFYKVSTNDLVITKMNPASANFEELKESKFIEKIKAMKGTQPISTINIGQEINPFWQTLSEQKYIHYLTADIEKTKNIISNNQYQIVQESETQVYIPPAHYSIQSTTSTAPSNGSNHLYRMYAFKQVMKDYVSTVSDSSIQNYSSLSLAEDANVVTPISSLIVLETDEDYKKQDIKQNENTLGNASMNNHGAVPEPHEWALMILGASILWLYRRKIMLFQNKQKHS